MLPVPSDPITVAFKSYLEGRRSMQGIYGQPSLQRHLKNPDTLQRVAANLGYIM